MASKQAKGPAPPASSRAPIKNSSAQRRAMTERRYQLSNSIRKAKRSHAVTLKRRCNAAGVAAASSGPTASAGTGGFASPSSMSGDEVATKTSNPVVLKLVDLASAYVRSCRYEGEGYAGCLSALQDALAKSEADSRSIDSLLKGSSSGDSGDKTPALLLSETLAKSLSSPLSTDEVRLDASRVLTNFAATGGGGNEENYYGMTNECWCDVIIRSPALPALISVIDTFSRSCSRSPPSQTDVTLCGQCCWALGNIAGDSQRARDAARSSGAIPPLVRALRAGFHWARQVASAGAGLAGVHATAEVHTQTVGLCRNSAWALSNLARGAYTSAAPFLSSHASAEGDSSLFTDRDLSELLAAQELDGLQVAGNELHVDSIHGEMEIPDSSWLDVANEVAWIVAFLSAREDNAVDYLIGGDTQLCESLAYRLSNSSDVVLNATGEHAEDALRMCIPCIRAVGNIAAACDGLYVAKIIQTKNEKCSPIPVSLGKLIQLGTSRGGDFSSVASEAAWAAGTLLCDAGKPAPHPSTVACDVLIPVLCGAITSGLAKLELKREAVSALCNAISAPPASPGMVGDSDEGLDDTALVRRQILQSVSEVDGLIPALTGLLLSFDVDAVYASIQVIDALLRCLENVPHVRRLFEEAGCLDALETVCDRASSSSSYGQDRWQGNSSSASERSAEIAADLIDDVFEEEMLSRDESETPFPVGTTVTSSGETRYAFGTNSAGLSSGVGFDFSGGANAFGQALQTPQGSGRGRGRGKVLPSWMQQQPS